jgi:hypothetical protein
MNPTWSWVTSSELEAQGTRGDMSPNSGITFCWHRSHVHHENIDHVAGLFGIFFAAGSDKVGDVGINCERLGDVDDRVGFESFGLIPNSPADRTAGLP